MTADPFTDAVKDALLDRAEDLFRQAWGEPEKAGAREWRAKSGSSRAMVMHGPRRGLWRRYGADEGGDLLDLIAVEFCGLSRAKDDFGRVVNEAARWCGLGRDAAPDLTEVERRRKARQVAAEREEAAEARRKAGTVAEIIRQARPVAGTAAEAYLRSRGITAWPEGAVAYVPPLRGGVKHPEFAALVVWARNDLGEIVGGQRILILPDGSRAQVEERKPSFGRVSGFPARFPARVAGGPLIEAEGPETALSAWMATGAEVWAAFGADFFASSPLPVGRKVILCPDRDAPVGTYPAGSEEAKKHEAAARSFAKGKAAQIKRGVEIWIAEAPEPEGSKRDLNDTHQRAGLDAVVEAIGQAVRFSPGARPAEVEILPDVATARAQLQAEAATFFRAVERFHNRPVFDALLRPEGPLHVLAAGLGLGKTRAALAASVARIRALRAAGDDAGAAVVLVPMHRLGEQIADDLMEMAPELEVAILRGVEAEDPDRPGEKVCKQLDAYREASSLLLDPVKTVCRDCPFAGSCLAMQARQAKADVYLCAHGALGSKPAPAHKWRAQYLDHAVIDEDPTPALLFGTEGKRLLGAAAWSEARSTDPTLDVAREMVIRAAEANGAGPLRRESFMGGWIEPAEADAAAEAEWSRKIGDPRDPEIEENRTISRAAGIFREIAAFLRSCRPASGRLVVVNDAERGLSLMHRGVGRIEEGWRKAPVLMLDATAQPEIIAAVMGQKPDRIAHVFAGEPNLRIVQDPTRSGAKSMLIEGKTDAANMAAANWRRKLAAFIRSRTRGRGRVLVVGNKDLLAKLEGLPENAVTAHFGALRGLNDFAEVETAVIVGRWQPPQWSVEAQTAAIFGDPTEGTMQLGGTVERLVCGPDGLMWREGKATVHSDPRANAVLSAIRDAEVEQAIGRLRAVNRDRPVEVVLLSDAVVRQPVTLAPLWSEIAADDPVEKQIDAAGVAFLSAAHAAEVFPQFWASKQAAQRAGLTGQQISYRLPYEECCPVAYRVPRRAEVYRALVDVTRHPDPVAAVLAMLPQARDVTVEREVEPVPVEETQRKVDETPAAQEQPAAEVVPAEALAWARAERTLAEAKDNRRKREVQGMANAARITTTTTTTQGPAAVQVVVDGRPAPQLIVLPHAMRPLVARVHAFGDLRERLGEPVRQYRPEGRLYWSRSLSAAVAQVVEDYFGLDENDPAAWG